MANREEALQSQAEVTRILVEQEIQDLVSAIDQKMEMLDKSDLFSPVRDGTDLESLSQGIFKLSSLMSQKCVTEAQMTILNTLLGCEVQGSGEPARPASQDSYVFNPENMNSECNEFMLVLNNYRQQNPLPAAWSPALPSPHSPPATSDPASLESNLISIRRENENKKARLSAALEDRRTEESWREADLRVWCEKSMSAMENSYENLLQELQLQHCKERDSLKAEKEQALAEETQATLAALDAMRKAHESEVQKEVERFKKEFLSELQARESIGALQSEYQSDRAEIRRELLSVTGAGPGGETNTTSAPPKLTRSPSCPRLYSALSLSTATPPHQTEEPLRSPLTGMVANRKRVFETEY